MARLGMCTSEARRNVRIAQFAGLGLGVLAAALWAMDVPGLGAALPTKPVLPESGGAAQIPVAATVPAVDREAVSGIGERLDIAANRPPVEAPPAPPPTPVAPPTGRQWKYLGTIGDAMRTRALVSLDGGQKIVGEGSMLSITTPEAEGRQATVDYKATVLTIQPDHIMIEEDGGAKRRVDLEARGAKVAWVKNMHTTVASAHGGVNGALSAEARQRLIAQGIDPAQAERMRQAAAANLAAAGRTRAMPDPNNPNNNPMLAAGSRGLNVAGSAALQKGAPTVPLTKAPMNADDAATVDGAVKKKIDAETAN